MSLNAIAPSPPVSPPIDEVYDLNYLFDDPVNSVENYTDLIEMCLAKENPHALFIQGVHDYFHLMKIDRGLEHLKRSADAKCDVAAYLYGILMVCRGEIPVGRRYLSTLKWKKDMARADYCWEKVKISLKKIKVERMPCYGFNLMLIKPVRKCHIGNPKKRCKRCFVYKQVLKFVDYI